MRRGVSAILASVAVVLTVLAAERRTAPPPTTSVVVATADLPGGRALAPGDIETARIPASAAPPGAVRAADATGRRLVGPIAAGEVVTATRLRRDGARADGRVEVHLLAEDPASLDRLGAGSVVTVYPAGGGAALTREGVVVAVDDPPGAGRPIDAGPWGDPGSPASRGLVVALAPGVVDRVFAGQRPVEGPPVVSIVPSP